VCMVRHMARWLSAIAFLALSAGFVTADERDATGRKPAAHQDTDIMRSARRRSLVADRNAGDQQTEHVGDFVGQGHKASKSTLAVEVDYNAKTVEQTPQDAKAVAPNVVEPHYNAKTVEHKPQDAKAVAPKAVEVDFNAKTVEQTPQDAKAKVEDKKEAHDKPADHSSEEKQTKAIDAKDKEILAAGRAEEERKRAALEYMVEEAAVQDEFDVMKNAADNKDATSGMEKDAMLQGNAAMSRQHSDRVTKLSGSLTSMLEAKTVSDAFAKLRSVLKESAGNEVQAFIREAHHADMNKLAAAQNAFSLCKNQLSDAQSGAHNATSMAKARHTNSGSAHRECRTAESLLKETSDGCGDRVGKLNATRVMHCKAMPNHSQINPSECLYYDKEEALDVYYTRLKEHFASRLLKLQESKARCSSAIEKVASAKENCDKSSVEYNAKKSACVVKQMEMNQLSCNLLFLQRQPCDEYSSCYNAAAKSFSSLEAHLKTAVAERQSKWVMSEKMRCLVDFATNATQGAADAEKIKACENKEVDTASLEISLAEIPSRTSCSVAEPPCSSNYSQQHFLGLPSGVKLLPCMPCAGWQIDKV